MPIRGHALIEEESLARQALAQDGARTKLYPLVYPVRGILRV